MEDNTFSVAILSFQATQGIIFFQPWTLVDLPIKLWICNQSFKAGFQPGHPMLRRWHGPPGGKCVHTSVMLAAYDSCPNLQVLDWRGGFPCSFTSFLNCRSRQTTRFPGEWSCGECLGPGYFRRFRQTGANQADGSKGCRWHKRSMSCRGQTKTRTRIRRWWYD